VLALVPDFELPRRAPDGRIYLTTDQAAAAMQVSKSTISVWKSNGLITPLEGSPPRRPLYDYEQLKDAERDMRRKLIEDGHEYWAQRRPGLRKRKSEAA